MGLLNKAAAGIGKFWSKLSGSDYRFSQNKQMAEYQYSKDLEMWNRQNAYNHPSEQMARYKEAGLNPALMYGSGGSASAGSATEMPQYNAPTFDWSKNPINILNTLSAFQDLRVKKANADKESALSRAFMDWFNQGVTGKEGDVIKDPKKLYTGATGSKWKKEIDLSAITGEKRKEWEWKTSPSWDKNWFSQTFLGMKDMSELFKTQQSTRKTAAEADLRDVEAETYRQLGKLGEGQFDAKKFLIGLLKAWALR